MHPHAELIQEFYAAFARRDADAMVACYHRDVVLSDPAFGGLDATHTRGMWRMLCGRAKDLVIESSGIEADATRGRAHWEADYTFAVTGRKVHNVIDATFEFAEGKISRHDDVFDMWRWTKMALGIPGVLLGWTPILRGAVRRKANAQLAGYLISHPEAGQA